MRAISLLAAFDWPSFFAGLVGAVVGAAASLIAVLLTHSREEERDRLADQRRLRDEKRERLRSGYVRLIMVAEALHHVAMNIVMQFESETEQQRAERLGKVLSEAGAGLPEAVARLQLESDDDARSLVDTYMEVFRAYNEFRIGSETNAQWPRTLSTKDLVKNLQTLETGSPKLAEAARAHLAKLEEPI